MIVGEDLPQTKLTREDVIEIKDLLDKTPRTAGGLLPRGFVPRLAEDYGVSTMTINRIKRGDTWRWMF